jgi:hypothetical protein
MHSIPKISAKFLVTLIVMTILCTVVWQQFVTDTLYHCTDALWLDFLRPGHWVHEPVASVAQVVRRRSMSEPDTIRAGWSMTGLWSLWYSFVGVSVAVSALLARAPWIPRRRTSEIYEQHAA